MICEIEHVMAALHPRWWQKCSIKCTCTTHDITRTCEASSATVTFHPPLFLFCSNEASELLQDLVGYEEVQQPILTGLVGMVKVSDDVSVPKAILGR